MKYALILDEEQMFVVREAIKGAAAKYGGDSLTGKLITKLYEEYPVLVSGGKR